MTDFGALPKGFGDEDSPDIDGATKPRELFVRHARKDGRSVAMIRAVDYGDTSVVNAEVFPHDRPGQAPVAPGPYPFPDPRGAAAFVTAAVEALMVLGCDVHAL